MYEPTDDEADAAQIAFHEFGHGYDEPPLTHRELGFTRMGWKAALKAAHEARAENVKRKGW